ncbi:two-component system sensor histidine kinase NtrB [Coralloluteibacterium thermophilus]|uniref:histidine kinase n=1 Tax=Coralloluteibacterium thermophilum TaxID=2707049 RepID=A0ABV9NK69_9GAMM
MTLAPTLDALALPVAWTDGEGRIAGCNPAFARWLGVSARRLEGLPVTELDADDGRLARLVARLPDETDPVRARRVRLRAPGGADRFAELLLAQDDDGLRLEALPVEEFPGAEPASDLPAALHAALRGLAHEIRNPLAGLKGAAQLLARRVEDEESRTLVELVESECARLAGLLDRLLDPAPARPLVPLNIHGVLERVRVLAEAEAGWTVRLERDYDPSLPEVLGDADRLTQALWNLVRNALESGAGTVVLRTRAERRALIGAVVHRLALRIEVEDDGRGVPEDLTERIFLPLVSGRAEGSGLGLPLAQQILREHGGALTYRSRPGRTLFILTIPVPAGGVEGVADGA